MKINYVQICTWAHKFNRPYTSEKLYLSFNHLTAPFLPSVLLSNHSPLSICISVPPSLTLRPTFVILISSWLAFQRSERRNLQHKIHTKKHLHSFTQEKPSHMLKYSMTYTYQVQYVVSSHKHIGNETESILLQQMYCRNPLFLQCFCVC